MEKLNVLADKIIAWQHKTDPFLATRRGIYDYDDLVPDYTEHAMQRRLIELKCFLKSLHVIDIAELDIHQQVNWQLVDIMLRQQIRELTVFKPLNNDPGYVAGQIMNIAYTMLSREYAPITNRLQALQLRLDQIEKLLADNRVAIQNPPLEYTQQAIIQCRNGGIRFFQKNVPEMILAQGGELTVSIKNTISNALRAFNDHILWLESLLEHSNGKFTIDDDIFNEMLQKDYLMSYDVEGLIGKGWELLNKTTIEMTALAQQINKNSTWQQIIEGMKQEHPTSENVLLSYQTELDKVKQFVIDHNIADFPKNEELILIETPLHMRSLFPYAGYSGPAVFDTFQSGRFWVTPVEDDWDESFKEQKLREHMYYKLPVFVLHEGYPGHHLQITTQHNLPENIRKIVHNNLFVEGWAFYCEELLENLGYINHPKTRLSRLKDQLWRASRIIIDASIHTGRMTFEEAVDFLVGKAHLERLNAVAEVSRYIKNPLRPMSYLMGKLEIVAIADEYKKRKGDSFSMKEFHNSLLSLGAIPPSLVKKELFE